MNDVYVRYCGAVVRRKYQVRCEVSTDDLVSY